MINTRMVELSKEISKELNKNKLMTPAERKEKVRKLKQEHKGFFEGSSKSSLYIPKMAYRPPGKDDLYVSFFPSEMIKGSRDTIYTEFVSIDYDAEDPKRTLYEFNVPKDWKDKYELIVSNSGYERHLIPVKELKAVSDVTAKVADTYELDALPNPETERDIVDVLKGIEKALLSINQKLSK